MSLSGGATTITDVLRCEKLTNCDLFLPCGGPETKFGGGDLRQWSRFRRRVYGHLAGIGTWKRKRAWLVFLLWGFFELKRAGQSYARLRCADWEFSQ